VSLLRRVLGVMPKRQITAVGIAGVLLIVTAGGVLGANAAATGMANPDLITLVEQDMTNGTMNASQFQSSEVETPETTETVLENPTLNRLFTPLVKLAFYPAQAGSQLGYWSVGGQLGAQPAEGVSHGRSLFARRAREGQRGSHRRRRTARTSSGLARARRPTSTPAATRAVPGRTRALPAA